MKQMILLLTLLVTTLFAGSARGPQTAFKLLPADDYHFYVLPFVGGQEAVVTVQSTNGADVDLYVLDENENEVCRSTSYSGVEYCTWSPIWTGNFKIYINNTESYNTWYNFNTN